MADQVDFSSAFHIPEVDGQDEKRAVHILKVDFIASLCIQDDQSDARRRGDGSTVLVSKTTHTSSDGLLLYGQTVETIILFTNMRLDSGGSGSYGVGLNGRRRRRNMKLLLLLVGYGWWRRIRHGSVYLSWILGRRRVNGSRL